MVKLSELLFPDTEDRTAAALNFQQLREREAVLQKLVINLNHHCAWFTSSTRRLCAPSKGTGEFEYRGGGVESSVYFFCHFATHPMSEGNGIYDTSPEALFFLLFKSPSVQISYCSITINVEKKEA